ncbi:MAG: DUF2299 family protein [Acidilobaceae archaeon]|nr:DUF2299 family protein [Acidilobaceae archaeon]
MSMRDRVLIWLAEEGLETRVESVPAEIPIDWALSAFLPGPLRIGVTIQQPKDRKDLIMLSMGIMLGPEHREGLAKLAFGEKVSIANEILKSLILLCPDCSIVVQPSLEDLQYISVSRVHYANSVTKEELMYSVRVLGNAFVLVVSELNSALAVRGLLRKSGGEDISM